MNSRIRVTTTKPALVNIAAKELENRTRMKRLAFIVTLVANQSFGNLILVSLASDTKKNSSEKRTAEKRGRGLKCRRERMVALAKILNLYMFEGSLQQDQRA